MKLRTILSSIFLFGALFATAQELIPTPVEVSYKGKKKVKVEQIDAKVDGSLDLPTEGYTLEIKGTTAVLRAKTAQGLVWAKATLAQLHDEEGLVSVVVVLIWVESSLLVTRLMEILASCSSALIPEICTSVICPSCPYLIECRNMV